MEGQEDIRFIADLRTRVPRPVCYIDAMQKETRARDISGSTEASLGEGHVRDH